MAEGVQMVSPMCRLAALPQAMLSLPAPGRRADRRLAVEPGVLLHLAHPLRHAVDHHQPVARATGQHVAVGQDAVGADHHARAGEAALAHGEDRPADVLRIEAGLLLPRAGSVGALAAAAAGAFIADAGRVPMAPPVRPAPVLPVAHRLSGWKMASQATSVPPRLCSPAPPRVFSAPVSSARRSPPSRPPPASAPPPVERPRPPLRPMDIVGVVRCVR